MLAGPCLAGPHLPRPVRIWGVLGELTIIVRRSIPPPGRAALAQSTFCIVNETAGGGNVSAIAFGDLYGAPA